MEVKDKNNGHFLEQQGQSDACIGYAELRQNRSEAQSSIVNGQSSIVNGQLSIVNRQWSMVNGQRSTFNGQRVLFIDRDGTLVIEPPVDYQLDAFEKLKFYPKVMKNLGFIRSKLDFLFVMVTNQDGLGSAQHFR